MQSFHNADILDSFASSPLESHAVVLLIENSASLWQGFFVKILYFIWWDFALLWDPIKPHSKINFSEVISNPFISVLNLDIYVLQFWGVVFFIELFYIFRANYALSLTI